jgi:FkbM family methyltransferase
VSAPSERWEKAVAYAHINAPWRRLFKNRTVTRNVQGTELYLPWSHRLPDYVRARPEYGQDLVGLAVALETRRGAAAAPMGVLDVGANVGDSAAQILDATSSARVLCVEADPYYLKYLRKNVGANPRAAIEEVLLTPNDDAWSGGATAVRKGGTTHFVASEDHESMPMLSVGKLREKHADFDDLRLVKSDTDGWDTTLVPAIAREWADAGPVLHFEFDPGMTREVAGVEPNDVWAALAGLGYARVAVWDNGGGPLGQFDVGQAAEQARILEPRPVHLGYHFWDVAVCRGDDHAARAAFDELVPEPFSPERTARAN